MISKTRTNLCSTVTVNNIVERDINNCQWDKLNINRQIAYYKITQNDLQRPDLIAQKIYGTFQYWWVLMKFNQIDDCWNDMVVGDVIKCPNKLDIEEYFSTTKSYA